MARRKDHTPQQLKALILSSASAIVALHGRDGLTARALASAINYSPGTIYNCYQDMDALIIDVNYETLGRLYEFCRQRIAPLPPDLAKISALAYAYVDFALRDTRAWESVFAPARRSDSDDQSMPLPQYYQDRLAEIFFMIESTLHECLAMPVAVAQPAARLLWACLHGITVLTLNGTLDLVGADEPHAMIDDLFGNYLAQYLGGR